MNYEVKDLMFTTELRYILQKSLIPARHSPRQPDIPGISTVITQI